MDFKQLRSLIAAAEEQNFKRAALKLNLTQSALWLQIKKLEEDLGVRLFTRRKGGLELSAAGEVFVADARKLLEQAQHARERAIGVAAGHAGSLRLGVTRLSSSHAVVLEAIGRFQREYPDVALKVDSRSSPGLVAALLEGGIDGAFVIREMTAWPGIAHVDIEARRPMLAMSRSNPLAKRRKLRLADLKAQRFYWFARELNPTVHDQLLIECMNKGGFSPKIVQTVNDSMLALSLIQSNSNVFFSSALENNHGAITVNRGLVAKPVDDLEVISQFSFAWQKNSTLETLTLFASILRGLLCR